MANNREIRRRIKSVKNTAQITKAMQMVASAKMRKAQQRAVTGRPYAEILAQTVANLRAQITEFAHPLLVPRPVKRHATLVISTDKGLCGALNTNLFREIQTRDSLEKQYVTIGRKGRQFIPRLKKSSWRPNLLADFELKDVFAYHESKRISQFLLDKYMSGEIDAIDVAYPQYVNTLLQQPKIVHLVPLGRPQKAAEAGGLANYVFEPDAQAVLSALLPFVVHQAIYQYILEARASEHSSRMVAMKNATENAKELVQSLTLEYNQVRQAGITTELLEITTAQTAVN
jgi:F-type H+-transporting ATPase subunit gamma